MTSHTFLVFECIIVGACLVIVIYDLLTKPKDLESAELGNKAIENKGLTSLKTKDL
jgi:hypothetical protein